MIDIERNNTFDEGKSNLIFDGFVAMAKAKPNNTAIRYNKKQWLYSEVDEISLKIATLLISRKLKLGDTVGLYADKTPAFVMAILGVARAGGVVVILDNSYPEERISEINQIINLDYLVDCRITTDSEIGFISKNFPKRNIFKLPENLTLQSDIIDFECSNDGEYRANSNDIAYYLFTSGTTGKPKCIAANHRPLCHFVEWQSSQFLLNDKDKFTMLSGISHDPILRDIFTPLSTGACILIPKKNIQLNPLKFFAWLKTEKPTVCHLTPQMSKLIAAGARDDSSQLAGMRYYFFGGDVLAKTHVTDIYKLSPGAKVVNFYGSTETPQAMGYYELPFENITDPIPIGKGILDVELVVLNDNSEKTESGEIGEITIHTEYLSQNYLNTSQNRNFSGYASGDYGYYQDDGNIVFSGRKDDQVKIRGYRVQLNDISAYAKSISGIQDALTLIVAGKNEENRLVLYLVKEIGFDIDVKEVNQYLESKLPNYMIPAFLILLEKFPLLPNGKVDRKSLPDPEKADVGCKNGSFVEPKTEREQELVEGMKGILGLREISIQDSFTTLAGDSLSYVETTIYLEGFLGHVPENWNKLTLEQLASVPQKKNLFHEINSTIFMRAISIVVILIYHFLTKEIDHGTGVLLIIAGISFANFQMKSISHVGSVTPILLSVFRLVLPTMVLTILCGCLKHVLIYPQLFFVSNFIVTDEYFVIAFWFIHLLVQLLLIMAMIMSIKKIRLYAMAEPKVFGFFFLIISLSFAIIVPYFWDTSAQDHRLPHDKLWYFAFGWCVYYSTTIKEKLMLATLMIVVSWITLGMLSPYLLIAATILLLVEKVKIITPFHRIFYILAGASLFIYITHYFTWRTIVFMMGEEFLYPAITIPSSIIVGVLSWHAWNKAIQLIVKLELPWFSKDQGQRIH